MTPTNAAALPQLDATSLVDGERLEAAVKDMYRSVARGEDAELHFEVGRALAEHLGYPRELLDAIPPEALASFAGVGHHLDLAALRPGEAVLDLGSGSGTDVFCAAVLVGESGRVVGVDLTDEQLDKAERLRDRRGFAQVEFVEARIEQLPFEDARFDVVLSNGVVEGAHATQRRAVGRMHRRSDSPQQLHGSARGAGPAGQGTTDERLPLHLRAGARRLQHLRGRKRLAARATRFTPPALARR
jgi:SAM-dependent methyltransferase